MNCFGKLKQDYLIALKEANRVGYERCDFNNDCDKCKSQKLGTFADMVYSDVDECNYYICGKCVLKNRKKRKIFKKRTEDTLTEKSLFK